MILLELAIAADLGADGRLVEERREVEASGLPVVNGLAGFEFIDAADHFLNGAEAEFRHDLAEFLRDEAHEVHGVGGIAGEVFAEFGILRGHAHRAGVFVANAHHDAAERDERRGGETEFLGTEKRGDGDIAAGLELAIGLHRDTAAEVVQNEGLVGLGETEFPRHARVLDARERRGAGASVEAADENDIRVGLGNAGRNRADADFGDEFHRNARSAVGVFEIVDEFRQILDRVDVVVWRWRNEADAGRGATGFGDRGINLRAGQFAAFTGLRALRHLDLDFAGVGEVVGGDAEAAGGDLLDGGVHRVAVLRPGETLGILAAFAGVRFSAEAVHRDGEGFVGFLRDRAVAHRAGFETTDDFIDRLDFFDRDRRGFFELKQTAQGEHPLLLVVHERGVFLEGREVAGADGFLERVDRLRVEKMLLAVATPLVVAAGVECWIHHFAERVGAAVAAEKLLANLLEADALDARGGPAEILVHNLVIEADGFENLRAAVALNGGNAHLGHGLDDALHSGLDEIFYRLFVIHAGEHSLTDHVVERLEGEVGVDGADAVAEQEGEVMHFARFSGFQNDCRLRAGAVADEVVVQAGHRQKRGDGDMVFIHSTVAQDEDVLPCGEGLVGIGAKGFHSLGKSSGTDGGFEKDRDGHGTESLGIHMPDLLEGGIVDDRLVELDHAATLRSRFEEVPFGTQHRGGRRDDFLADRVDRRVGDLREELLEVIVEKNRLVGEHGERGIGAHRTDRLNAIAGHRAEDHALVFERVTKRLLALEDRLVIRQVFGRRLGQVREEDMVLIQPLAVGMLADDFVFDLLVRNNTAL